MVLITGSTYLNGISPCTKAPPSKLAERNCPGDQSSKLLAIKAALWGEGIFPERSGIILIVMVTRINITIALILIINIIINIKKIIMNINSENTKCIF